MHYKKVGDTYYFDVASKKGFTENGNLHFKTVMLIVFWFLVLGLVMVWAHMTGVTLQ